MVVRVGDETVGGSGLKVDDGLGGGSEVGRGSAQRPTVEPDPSTERSSGDLGPAAPQPLVESGSPGMTVAADAPSSGEVSSEVALPTSSVGEESATEEPAAEVPAAEVLAADESAAEVPAADEPAADEPDADEPAAEVPAAEEPAAEVPAAEEPEPPSTSTAELDVAPASDEGADVRPSRRALALVLSVVLLSLVTGALAASGPAASSGPAANGAAPNGAAPMQVTAALEGLGSTVVARSVPVGLLQLPPPAGEGDTMDQSRAVMSRASTVLSEAVSTVRQAPADARPPVVARYGSLELRVPGTKVMASGFHEAATSNGLPMEPVGTMLRNLNATKFEPANDTAGPGTTYLIMSSRGRSTPATSALDVLMPRGEPVLSPVTGVVADVRQILVEQRHPDLRVELWPDEAPDLRVAIVHLDGVRVSAGDRVEAGITVLADTSRQFPFLSQIDNLTYPELYPHVHLEVQPRDANRPGGTEAELDVG